LEGAAKLGGDSVPPAEVVIFLTACDLPEVSWKYVEQNDDDSNIRYRTI